LVGSVQTALWALNDIEEDCYGDGCDGIGECEHIVWLTKNSRARVAYINRRQKDINADPVLRAADTEKTMDYWDRRDKNKAAEKAERKAHRETAKVEREAKRASRQARTATPEPPEPKVTREVPGNSEPTPEEMLAMGLAALAAGRA
jgi:FtsZ-interacting cell division protein ZipA